MAKSNTVNRRVNIYINGQEVENSGKKIRAEWVKARNELNKTNKSAKEYQDRLKRFRQLDGALRQHRQELSGVNRSWNQFKTIAGSVLLAGGIAGAIQGFSRFVTGMVKSNAELSDSLADVRKTTGLTAEEVDTLAGKLRQIDTRTSRKELLALAKEAGRLGMTGVKDIEAFVRKADQIQVALGEDLGDGAVLQIGKIADAFGTDLLNIGSAINEVGANSKATEGYLVEFTARMQGVGVSAGLSSSDIMGFAATLDSLGLKSEMSATALNTFFMDFVKDTEKFEKAAGMAEGSLQKLIGEEGTNAGFMAFLRNIKASSTSTKDFLKRMEDLGINGARGAQTFLALSNNIDEVAKMQGIANDAFEKGTSLTEEFNVKNNNLAANLEKLQRKIKGIFSNSALTSKIESFVGIFASWVDIPLSEILQQEAVDLRVLEQRIWDANTPTEERVKLIKDLQERYPNYLNHLDADKVTNQELSSILTKINDQLVTKIMLQKMEEERTGAATFEANTRLQIREMENELLEKLVELEDKYGVKMNKNLSTIEKAQAMREHIEANGEKGNWYDAILGGDVDALEIAIRNIEDLGGVADQTQGRLGDIQKRINEFKRENGIGLEDEPAASPNASASSGMGSSLSDEGLSDDEQKALDKKAEEVRAANEKALADLNKLRTEYYLKQLDEEELMEKEKLRIQLENDIAEIENSVASEALKREQIVAAKDVTEQAIQAVSDKYEAMREEKRIEEELRKEEAQLRIQEALMSDYEYRIYQEAKYWDDLIAEAEVGSAEYEALLDAKMQAINAIVKEHVVAQFDEMSKTYGDLAKAGQGFGEMATGVMQLVGEEGEKMSDFQKSAALFEIAMSSGEALAAAVAEAAKNPWNSVTAGAAGIAQLALYTGVIFSNMARAKKLIAGGDKPKYATGGWMLKGPGHSGGGMPVIDPRTGMPVAEVEGGEAILSRSTVQNNRGLVDALLDTSMNRGGAALPFLQAENQRGINFDGLSVNRPFGSADFGSAQSATVNIDSQQIANAVASQIAPFVEEMRNWKRNINANVNLKQFDDARDELEYIKTQSGMNS